jgi:hypothetical protein
MRRGLDLARTECRYDLLVVACNPYPDVLNSSCWDIAVRNKNQDEPYINRVYRAWNTAVLNAKADWIVLISSDMFVSDWWLDELVRCKEANPDTVPTSLLVESGRIPSAFPEYVRNHGVRPTVFDEVGWHKHAEEIREVGVSRPGRLFGPVLFSREEFLAAGGYPEENPGGRSGDKVFFERLRSDHGLRHVTCMGSVVYHVQEGEMRS